MQVLLLLIILLAAVIAFGFLPSLLCFLVIVSRREGVPLEERKLEGSYFEPYQDELLACSQRLRAMEWQTVRITAGDGVPLEGRFLDRGGPRIALLFHGYNSTPLNNFCLQTELLLEQGFSVLLPDERAHGKSGGRISGLGLKEADDILAWVAWSRRERPEGELLLYGMSMGCTALAFASDRLPPAVRAMVLDCGYVSLRDQILHACRRRRVPGRIMLPFLRLFVGWFLRGDIRRRTCDTLCHTHTPALFLHGEGDTAVPVTQGQINFDSCASEKERLFVPGAEHTMAFPAGGPEARAALCGFIQHHFKGRTP